jgi:hypothetical protein
LRVQRAGPGVELFRLAEGARRVTRNADHKHVRWRVQRSTYGKQGTEPEELVESVRRRKDACYGAEQSQR